MEEYSSVLNILNTIKNCNNSKDIQKWVSNASFKFFEIEIEKLKVKLEYMEKERERAEEDIQNITPNIEILKNYHKTLIDAFRVSQDSLLNQRLYLKCVEKSVAENKEKGDRILRELREQIDKCKEKLEANSPNFQIFKEKTSDLQKSKYNIRVLQQNIKERKKINHMKSIFSQKLFYSDYVDLAAVWLKNRKYDEAVQELDSIKKLETELIAKLIGNTPRFNRTQKDPMKKIKENDIVVNMDTLELPALRALGEMKIKPPSTNYLQHVNNSSSKDASTDRAVLNSWHNSNYLADNQLVDIPSKINIIENKVINVAEKANENSVKITIEQNNSALDLKFQQLIKNFDESSSLRNKSSSKISLFQEKASDNSPITENIIKNMSQKERDRALEIKLQNVVKNFNRPASHGAKNRLPTFVLKEEAKIVSDKAIENDGMRPMGKPSTKVTENIQVSQNPVLSSQENYDVGNMISQESNRNVSEKLADFKHELKEVQMNYENISNQNNSIILSKNTPQFSINNNFGQSEMNTEEKLAKHVHFSKGSNRNICDQITFEKKINKPLTNVSQYYAKNDKNEPNEPKSFGTFGRSSNISEKTMMKRGSAFHNDNTTTQQTEKHFTATGFMTDGNPTYTPPVNTPKDMKNVPKLSQSGNVDNAKGNAYNFGNFPQLIQSPSVNIPKDMKPGTKLSQNVDVNNKESQYNFGNLSPLVQGQPVNITNDVETGTKLSQGVDVQNNNGNPYHFGNLSQLMQNPPEDFNDDFLMSPVYDTRNRNETGEPALPFENTGFTFQGMNFGFNF